MIPAEHIWRFDLSAGNHVLNVDAHVDSPAGDGDSGFDLQWATSSEGPWATLLTVSANSDQDSYLSASIGSQTATTVYLRAIDNDSTTGNLTYSSLLVDHLFFDGGTPPDTPPGPATDPTPAHGSQNVPLNSALSWQAGAGASSHDLYFGEVNPPPFVANLNTSSYDPGPLSAATTYYWRVDEINALGTTTGSLWQFTTADSGSATTVSVSSISLGTSGGGKQGKYGEATVTVIDNLGNPVAGADVSGQFSGSYNESANATTNPGGVADITTSTGQKGGISFTFCVTNVVKSGLTYAAGGSDCANY